MTASNSCTKLGRKKHRTKPSCEDSPQRLVQDKSLEEQENVATSSDASAKCMPIHTSRSGVYRFGFLAVWIITSVAMVLDRFFWNIWARQTICSDGCGNDFFCEMDEDPGCLKSGPWTAKMYDVIARCSARMIISTTNVMFITMCHGTFNTLSEIPRLAPFLYSWRYDNFWLHTVAGWTLGVWIMLHVWSLFLPSIFNGYSNKAVGGEWDAPLQVTLALSTIDVDSKTTHWGYDDIWRIFWMTVIFAALMPLSRSAWALKKNFSLAMWLHMLIGCGVFFDSWRRKTHPHVWIVNTPVFLWWVLDKIFCTIYHRVEPCAEATRIMLDEEYMLLLWKDESSPKRICDLFWIKRGYDPKDPSRSGTHARRNGELAHPFTTCSSHDHTTAVKGGTDTSTKSLSKHAPQALKHPPIEPPIKTDVDWSGHRFTLTSVLTRMSSGAHDPLGSTRHSEPCQREPKPHSLRRNHASSSKLGRDRSWSGMGHSTAIQSAGYVMEHSVDGSTEYQVPGHIPIDEYHDQEEHGTMVGVDVTGKATEDMTVFIGNILPRAPSFEGRTMVTESVQRYFEDTSIKNEKNITGNDIEEGDASMKPKLRKAEKGSFSSKLGSDKYGNTTTALTKIPSSDGNIGVGETEIGVAPPAMLTDISANDVTKATPPLGKSLIKNSMSEDRMYGVPKTVLMRIDTDSFMEHRRREEVEGRRSPAQGSWSKMAIVRVHRRGAPKSRECSCLGITHLITSLRKTETGSIADLEAAGEGGSVPLRTYGPYRSEYGRLCEFPNLPPLLVVATGAGAALVLDFIGYVRANKLVAARPVSLFYSSASLPLLQFVTNSLLAERIPGIDIKTALTSHDDLKVHNTSPGREGELAMGRLDIEGIIATASSDTEVYFCGGGGINALLRKKCATRGMKYVGSSVQ